MFCFHVPIIDFAGVGPCAIEREDHAITVTPTTKLRIIQTSKKQLAVCSSVMFVGLSNIMLLVDEHLQSPYRIRRFTLQRLAGAEERPHCDGRDSQGSARSLWRGRRDARRWANRCGRPRVGAGDA